MIRTRLIALLRRCCRDRRRLRAGAAGARNRSDTHPPGKNPHLGKADSIKSGLALYRVRCGDCHGLDARGYRGPT